jgi:hypothetical protein
MPFLLHHFKHCISSTNTFYFVYKNRRSLKVVSFISSKWDTRVRLLCTVLWELQHGLKKAIIHTYVTESQLSVAVTNTRHNQCIRRKDYFGSQFWRFQSVIGWPCCFRPVASIRLGVHKRAKLLSSGSGHEKRERHTLSDLKPIS